MCKKQLYVLEKEHWESDFSSLLTLVKEYIHMRGTETKLWTLSLTGGLSVVTGKPRVPG